MNVQDPNVDEAPDERWYRVPSRWPGACGFVRWGHAGRLEVEVCDPPETAHRETGSDVAAIYTIERRDLPALVRAVSARTGAAADLESVPAALARSFSHVEALIAWLKDTAVPLSPQLDLVI